jgi:hypothetical protein
MSDTDEKTRARADHRQPGSPADAIATSTARHAADNLRTPATGVPHAVIRQLEEMP